MEKIRIYYDTVKTTCLKKLSQCKIGILVCKVKHCLHVWPKMDDPHYCELCNVVLKSESAYKSHFSKLHLERRTRIFYCRECGEIFHCKHDHQEHIQ